MRVNESFSLTTDSGFNTNMNTNYASGQEMAELSPMNVELKSLDATLEIVESTLANAGILHIGGLGAVSLAVMLGTISSMALLIRGTFVYYLTNYAPKGRAINRLMFLDQVVTFTFGLVYYLLTVLAIGTQTRLADYIGWFGCKMYSLSFMIVAGWFAIGGFGMAIFRLSCLQDQTMTPEMRSSIVKKIHMAQFTILIIIYLPVLSMMIVNDKWEILAMYRICTDQDLNYADISATYESRGSFIYPTAFEKGSFIFPVAMGQIMAIVEFGIYAKIIYGLWCHDKKYQLDGTITNDMKQRRCRKNIITLKGQIACFVIETSCLATYAVGFIVKFEDSSSINPVMTIFSQSLVSIAQFWASHELRRFVKEYFE